MGLGRLKEDKKKAARELKKEGGKAYSIKALWQWNHDLSPISAASSQGESDQLSDLLPIHSVSPIRPLSEVSRGGTASLWTTRTWRPMSRGV